MILSAQNVSWQRGENLVVNNISFAPKEGSTVGLLGPNGSGKSSFLKLLYAAARPTSGYVKFGDQDIHKVPRKQRAHSIAVVTQHASTDIDLSVYDVVNLGRIAYRNAFGPDANDEAIVREALEQTGLTEKANHPWNALSGGEQQRAQIARALAQQPNQLLLDEPTNHLDIKHQLSLMRLVRQLPVTCIVAIHDLNLAAMYCDELVLLQRGSIVAYGTPREVLTSEILERVYGVSVEVINHDGNLRVLYRD